MNAARPIKLTPAAGALQCELLPMQRRRQEMAQFLRSAMLRFQLGELSGRAGKRYQFTNRSGTVSRHTAVRQFTASAIAPRGDTPRNSTVRGQRKAFASGPATSDRPMARVAHLESVCADLISSRPPAGTGQHGASTFCRVPGNEVNCGPVLTICPAFVQQNRLGEKISPAIRPLWSRKPPRSKKWSR